MEYPKIHSLWKREKNNHNFIVGDYSIPEFANIKKWLVQEKIDGTNIRINFRRLEVDFYARTDQGFIPSHLSKYLLTTLTMQKLYSVFSDTHEIWLFGEGYGPKIQKGGGNYRKDVGFILFDVKVGHWWLEQSSVKEIAEKLDVPYAPIIGIMTEDEIVDYVKSKPMSLCSVTPQVMEGIIARPEPLLLLRNGNPLIMKLKCKEFKDEVD